MVNLSDATSLQVQVETLQPQLGVLEEEDEFEEDPASGELAMCRYLVHLLCKSCPYVIQRRTDWKDDNADVSTLILLSQAGDAASGAFYTVPI